MQLQTNDAAEQLRQKVEIAEMAAKDERLTPETHEPNHLAAIRGRALLVNLEKQDR